MSKVFLTMAMSLDGFITGPNDDAQNPAGIERHAPDGLARRRRDRRQHPSRLPAERPEQPDRLRRGDVERRRHHRTTDR